MDQRIIGMLVVGILAGACLGYGAAYLVFTPQINELKIKLSGYELQYEALSGQYETLSEEYENLKTEIDNLQTQYTELSSEYEALQNQYHILSNDYEEVSGYLKDLSGDVRSIIKVLNYYCNIPEAFEYVLTGEELKKIEPTVSSVTIESKNNWYAYEKIYKYVTYQIDYALDIEFPYISDYFHEVIDGKDIVTGFSVNTKMNYIQTPDFTIEYGQGDCEDQVILAYAMIKYYERNIYETEYTSYIADIQFSDGTSHLALFLPVIGGRTRENRLCILDPAGTYYTNKYGDITQREVLTELEVYSKVWKTAGEIKHIELYDVDVTDGSYAVASSGTLEEVAEFLEELE